MVNFEIDEDIQLKMLGRDQGALLFSVVDENRSHLKRWLPWLDFNISVTDSIRFIESTHRQYENGLGFMCGIFRNKKLIGMCGYHPIDRLNKTATIGFWIAENEQGMGVVTSCTKFLLGYAFGELGLNKVLIPAAEENYKSQAVSKRLGLTNEGIDREAEFFYGKFVNHIRYTMLKSEWSSC